MLYGTGMTAEDMNKAQVGIASVWYEGNTCNNALEQFVRGGQGRCDSRWPCRHAIQYYRR